MSPQRKQKHKSANRKENTTSPQTETKTQQVRKLKITQVREQKRIHNMSANRKKTQQIRKQKIIHNKSANRNMCVCLESRVSEFDIDIN